MEVIIKQKKKQLIKFLLKVFGISVSKYRYNGYKFNFGLGFKDNYKIIFIEILIIILCLIVLHSNIDYIDGDIEDFYGEDEWLWLLNE